MVPVCAMRQFGKVARCFSPLPQLVAATSQENPRRTFRDLADSIDSSWIRKNPNTIRMRKNAKYEYFEIHGIYHWVGKLRD